MDDYPYPITVEGDWRPEHAKSVKNKLQIYFQSKKKSQGGDCVVQYDDKCNFATILFKSSQSRDGVLSKAAHSITIDNQQIELKVYKPNTGQKTEQACGNQEPTAVKFLEDSRTHEKFKKNNLRTRALERSTSVRVENLPDEANNNKMLLELYFEKWGGPVDEVIIIPSEQAAIIIFKEEEAKERVLKRENNICDVPVKIYPYFKSLDTVLYGGKRPHLKLPEPITVSVHPAIREFILNKGQISSMKDRMSFCQINMDKPEVLLSPDPALLKQKGVTRQFIDGWNKNATDAFKKIISNYTTSEWPVSHALWSKVESDVKKEVKNQVFTDMDASRGVLTLAGVTNEINGLKPIIKKILERATNQMEREKNSVTEYMELPPAMYTLLEQDGLQNAVSPHLHTDYNKKMNKLILSGLHTETIDFKNWVLEKQINMKQKRLQIDRSILEFLRSEDSDEMSRELFISHGITAVYTIENGDVVVIGSTERALADAEKRVNTVFTTKYLTVEDQGVLQMPECLDLKKQLEKKRFVSINLSQREKVVVTGFREPVMEVSERLGSFIEKHTRIEETVRVKSHAAVEFIKDRKSQDWQHFIKSDEVNVHFDPKRPWIKLSGARTFVQPALTLFKGLADALYTDTLIIKKAGAKKYFMEQGKMMFSMLLKGKQIVVVLQEDDMLEEEVDEFTEGSFGDIDQVSCEVRMPGGVTVTVRKANICKLHVDAVVNAANEDLKHIGGLALALLQAAGPSLQQNCDLHTKANGPLKPGDAIITAAGRLPCKYVVHAVGPRFSDSDRHTTVQRLRRAVRESLNQATTRNCSSIAIPVISSGIFGCPLDLCTESVAKESDVIVNTISEDLDLSKGAISKALLQTAGYQLQSEIKRAARSNGVNYGEVVITDGYELKCQKVFHVVCPFWRQGSEDKVLIQIIRYCLKKAEKWRMASVVFPAIGTGNLGFPKDLVARIMLTEVQEFKPTNLREVTVVVHPSDKESIELCESRQITSVAFPALGTGQGGANPADVADAMVDAVVDFVKKKKPVHVKLVKFLIFQTNMVVDFHQCMVRRSGEKVEEDKGVFSKIKDTFHHLFWGESSESSKNEEFVMVGEEIEPVVFQLCGETPEDLSEAKDMINSMILREHVTIPIHDPAIAHFTKEDVETLNAMQRELTISVRVEKKGQDSVITLEGLTRDVHTANSRIRDMIRKVERNEKRRHEAFIISSVINWQYQENGRSLKTFDILTNYDLEQAYRNKQPSVRIKINNDEYEADLVRKVATRRGLRIELNRVDLQAAVAAAAQSPLPSHWDDMKGHAVVLVKLKEDSKEYAEVEKEFRRTNLNSKIIEIERVQNNALWKNYMIKKEELEDKNKHKNNEKRLFHGTGPDKTDQINNNGFNRSFAGMHGAMYGNGSYFAVDPHYSAKGYSKPDAKGHKRMYLVRVLVGDFTQGKPGLPVPPARSSNSADLYNSVTDNMSNPTMFVIFNDVQAYPEYLITFQRITMDEYPYPIIVEGNWESEQAKSVKNKLQIYFQSKKKSQGGDCAVKWDDKSNSATIQFKSSDIRDGVLSKAEHIITIDNQQIQLKVYKPSDAEEQTDIAEQRCYG
ncbi:hypothetical protein cypCar_00039653 [Cyprinus carpio]|nr:hypothetical protein cypCar_00039653 [Cyprinus carpio]